MRRRHGGNLSQLAVEAGRPMEQLLDFSASINPLGPPPWLRSVLSRHVERISHYPDPQSKALVLAIAAKFAVAPEQVVVGNGSTELLYAIPRALGASRAVIPVPAYVDYAHAAELAGLTIDPVELDKGRDWVIDWPGLEKRLRGNELVFLGQPNNPTGMTFDRERFAKVAAGHPASTFIVDESFADFVTGYQTVAEFGLPNVIVVKSFTKFYALPGLRIGCAIAPVQAAEKIRRLIPPWSVNVLAQAVGEAALDDEAYGRHTRAVVELERQHLSESLGRFPGFRVYPGQANFLLVESSGIGAEALASKLLQEAGIAIRPCEDFMGLDDRFFRVAVRSREENDRLTNALRACFCANRADTARPRAAVKQPHAIMFQGTGSSAGKSLLTAALCRILLQDGLRVAPFKAQNMSLNSFVTPDGGEIGRAQALQAQACRLEPDVRMNPILLKPSGDNKSQVIVRGKSISTMHYREYMKIKPQLFGEVTSCYDSLAKEYDAVVLEGAGSPAEVNLRQHDIVNMAMAHHAGAPVLLIGDIDKGGVFASLVGTMEVLDETDRRRIAGFVINRFRGDASLLQPAIDFTFGHTGRPTLGVVHHLPDLNLPEEDSQEFKRRATGGSEINGMALDIVLIDLPHISNFTDVDALRLEPDVRLRIVRSREELGAPDAVIVPGSKNTIVDLQHLRHAGLAQAIHELNGSTEIVGICGGFQMLGKRIRDPHGIETLAGDTDGLGLLNVTTVLAAEKTLLRVRAVHLPSGCAIEGYEIHHGETDTGGHEAALQREDGCVVGVASRERNVWGTYLHGVFDADAFRRWFLDRLRQRRGLSPIGKVVARYDLEPALNRLADAVRASMKMKTIYELMGL